MSYIREHWKGELTLAQSFWVNMFLLSFGFRLLDTFLFQWTPPPESLQIWVGLALIYLFAALFLVYPWQIVGTWRSSQRHEEETNKKGWSRVVRVLIIFGLFGTVGNLLVLAPTLKEMMKIIYFNEGVSEYELSLDLENNLIILNGAIGFGVSRDLDELLQANPEIKGIVLNSFGGRLAEGDALGSLIKEYRLDTYSSEQCLSACTVAFIHGKTRSITRNANLGFHSYQNVEDFILSSEISRQQDIHAKLFIENGVSTEFVSKMFDAEFDDMWYPSQDVLLTAGVIDGVIQDSQIRRKNDISSKDRLSTESAEEMVAEIPGIHAIKIYEPEIYEELMARMIKALNEGGSSLEIQNMGSEAMQNSVGQKLHLVSDNLLTRVNNVNKEILRSLSQADPFLCLKHLYSAEYGSLNYSRYLSHKQLMSLNEVLAQIFEESYQSVAPVINIKQAEMDLELVFDVMGELISYFDPSGLANREEYSKFCLASIRFIEATEGLGQQRTGNMYRYLYSLPE